MWRLWGLAVVLGGLINQVPFFVWPKLFTGALAGPEIISFLFMWIALLCLTLCIAVQHIAEKWWTALFATLGFSVSWLVSTIHSLRAYPVPLSMYANSFKGAFLFSGTACALGALIALLIRRVRSRRSP